MYAQQKKSGVRGDDPERGAEGDNAYAPDFGGRQSK